MFALVVHGIACQRPRWERISILRFGCIISHMHMGFGRFRVPNKVLRCCTSSENSQCRTCFLFFFWLIWSALCTHIIYLTSYTLFHLFCSHVETSLRPLTGICRCPAKRPAHLRNGLPRPRPHGSDSWAILVCKGENERLRF